MAAVPCLPCLPCRTAHARIEVVQQTLKYFLVSDVVSVIQAFFSPSPRILLLMRDRSSAQLYDVATDTWTEIPRDHLLAGYAPLDRMWALASDNDDVLHVNTLASRFTVSQNADPKARFPLQLLPPLSGPSTYALPSSTNWGCLDADFIATVFCGNQLYMFAGGFTLYQWLADTSTWQSITTSVEMTGSAQSCLTRPAIVAVDDTIYLVGGQSSARYDNSVWGFSTSEKSWRKHSDTQETAGYLSAAVVDNHIYAVGGRDGRRRLRGFERWNPTTERNGWTSLWQPKYYRCCANLVAVEKHLYYLGGHGADSIDADVNDAKPSNAVERYSCTSGAWTMVNSMPRACYRVAAGVLYGGQTGPTPP